MLDPLFRHETILDAIEKKKALLSECRSYNPIPDPLKGKGHMGRVIPRLEQEIAELEEEDRKLLLQAAQRRLFLNPGQDNRGVEVEVVIPTPQGSPAANAVAEQTSPAGINSGGEEPLASLGQPATTENVCRAILVDKVRREISEIKDALELPEDYDSRVRSNAAFVDFITVAVCNRHPDLRDKLCAIKTTKKPKLVMLACEIAARSNATSKPILAETLKDAHKRHGAEARKRRALRQ